MLYRAHLLLATLAVASSPLLANEGYTTGSEYEPALCPVSWPKIIAVHIEENGAKATAATDPGLDCSGFKLDEKKVRRYLSRAKAANESDAHHTLDWSPCYASGTLTFAGGKRANWSINQMQTGSLTIEGGNKTFLYCPRCRFKPFTPQ